VLVALVGMLLGLATVPALASHAGPEHWSKDGNAHAQVYIVDLTGAAWPVATVVYKWNEANSINGARFNVYYDSSCPSSSLHCVRVREYTNSTAPNSSCVGAYGCTISDPADANNHQTGVRVWLNNTTVTTAAQHRKSTCHEIGHVFRLNHRFVDGSCMEQGESPPISQYPDSHDYTGLYNLYNHGN
jgi:hypothetical protein